jgi:Zn-dependent metalloprotease
VYNFLHFLDKNNVPFRYDNLVILANVDNLENAFWNGSYLVFGNGCIGRSTALVCSSIVAHELTHAVIDCCAPLEYEGLSGALNESFADVFGLCYEFYIRELYPSIGWELGSETGLILRNIKEPELCRQPRKVDGMYYIDPNSYEDNGGVHINSGIPNHIFFCIQDIIGYRKAFDFFIRVLFKLNRYATFKDFRNALSGVNSSMGFIQREKLNAILYEHNI